MLQFDTVNSIIDKMVSNKKVAFYIKNKFKHFYTIPEEDEFDAVESYHWNLSKINFTRDNYIGYMPNNYYYDNIIYLDVISGNISEIPKLKTFLKREKNQDMAFKEFKKKVNEITQLVQKDKSKNASI